MSNPDANKQLNQGCQIVKMNFSLYGKNLENYVNFFNEQNSAFVLKPANLRPKVINLRVPKQQLSENIMDINKNPVERSVGFSTDGVNDISFKI